ncbi:MAG: hypothetical protein QNJ41_26730 [Xenococcaceae cyanobacterium MO_188.B32]|nr:hypothetical protein [Xenococcaceae cyanobacterium MO_188.B32]
MAIFRVSRNIIYNWLNNWKSLGLVGLYNLAERGHKKLFDTQQQETIKTMHDLVMGLSIDKHEVWIKPLKTEKQHHLVI